MLLHLETFRVPSGFGLTVGRFTVMAERLGGRDPQLIDHSRVGIIALNLGPWRVVGENAHRFALANPPAEGEA